MLNRDFNLLFFKSYIKVFSLILGVLIVIISMQTNVLVFADELDGEVYKYENSIDKTSSDSETGESGFIVNSCVRKTGKKSWKKTIIAEPGDKIDYLIKYENTSKLTQDKVVLYDILPKNFQVVEESLVIKNGLYPNIARMTNESLNALISSDRGLNIGKYQYQASAYLRFTVLIPEDIDLKRPGANVFRNTLIGKVNHIGYKSYSDVIIFNEEDETDVSDKKSELQEEKSINLYIDDDKIKIGDEWLEISDEATTPMIVDGKTLVPIRWLIENMGGEVAWKDDERKVEIYFDNHYIQVWLDDNKFLLDDKECLFATLPRIINGRTMLPLRELFEAIGCEVLWYSEDDEHASARVEILYKK